MDFRTSFSPQVLFIQQVSIRGSGLAYFLNLEWKLQYSAILSIGFLACEMELSSSH
jgi:hypothetical protein